MSKLRLIGGILAVMLAVAGLNTTFAQTAVPTEPATINLPDPTGPYKVGRTSYEWIDQKRDETYASAPGLKRDLMVYIWFPANPSKRAKIAPYMDDSVTWNNITHHPELDGMVHDHAYTTTTVATDKPNYPVLIFESDQDIVNFYYASTLEELASHGYIIVGMTHPYATGVISYPDGRLVTAGIVPQALPLGAGNGNPRPDALAVWTQDVQFVLDQLKTLNDSDKSFQGHLDLDRIGIIGHAVGATSAIKSAAADPRIKAGVAMNSLKSDDALSKPFLFVGFEAPPTPSQRTKDTFWMTNNKMTFLNFGDFTLLPASVAVTAFANSGGSIDPVLGIQINNSYLLAFFDHYLNGAELKWPTYPDTNLATFGQ